VNEGVQHIQRLEALFKRISDQTLQKELKAELRRGGVLHPNWITEVVYELADLKMRHERLQDRMARAEEALFGNPQRI